MASNKIDIEFVKNYISQQSAETKIYLGADSERIRVDGVWYVDYCLAVIVHENGNKGCKIFGEVIREHNYDKNLSRPILRLMGEVYKIAELYAQLEDVLLDREFEIHLDLNKNDVYGSSCAVQQAIGYIRGTCNVTPKIKPDAPAASFAADRLKIILSEQRSRENVPVA